MAEYQTARKGGYVRHIIYSIIIIAAISVSGCGISDAANDLGDALDDAMKADGPDSCYSVLEDVYEALDRNNCSETSAITEGETATSMANAWCEDNCDDLSSKLEYTDVSNCTTAISGLDCDALNNILSGSDFPGSCSWLDGDLGC